MDRAPARDATPEICPISEWHDALNRGELDLRVGLSNPDVEVGVPRGTGRGSNLLRDWTDQAGTRLVPRRSFHASGIVVVEQEAAWTSADTGGTTPAQAVASVFVVRDGMVASALRHDDLAKAVNSAGLDAPGAIEDG